MPRKLLIANRGEIACRIIRTARRMGVETVLAASEADRDSLAAAQADSVVLIGPAPAADSYLRADRIVEAARFTGCDAIHPGYGFLSESADFAAAVGAAGLAFVGPTPEAMRALGGKAAAKGVAIACDVPVVPGYQGEAQDAATLGREAARIGFPVLIKAVDGGGGRGMRLVERPEDLPEALASAQREAKAAFGSDRVLVEKLVVRPRHVEVQVFGDAHGNVVHLFERDCSLQRRNQKVIEEAPAPGMSVELRAAMTDAAVRLARAVGYRGAGTVEFLVEGGSLGPQARWYFIEMNTRLQVEHPVTEMITGLDLVEWQLRVADGEPLPLRQEQIAFSGHAIEARLNAEDPSRDFLPSVGRIVAFQPPPDRSPPDGGWRVESGVAAGSQVTPFYDSMIAKLIARGEDRRQALARLVRLIESTDIAGPRTNGAFLRNLLTDEDVAAGTLDTGLIARKLEALTARHGREAAVAFGVEHLLDWRRDDADLPALHAGGEMHSPWRRADGFQLGGARTLTLPVLVDGEPTTASVRWGPDGPRASWTEPEPRSDHAPRRITCHRDDGRALVVADLEQTEIAWPVWDAGSGPGDAGDAVRAPINGRVARLLAAEGDTVEKGARIAVIEAMKMEHVLLAPRAGTLARLAVREGDQVAQGALVAALAEST